MLSILATLAKDNPLDWEAHNHIYGLYTTPLYLMFSHQARILADRMFGSTTESVHEYAAVLQKQRVWA